MARPAVERMAKCICPTYNSKIFIINEASYDGTKVASLSERDGQSTAIVEALPIQGKYVLVVNTPYVSSCILWTLQERISAGIVINPSGWLSDEFFGTPAHAGMTKAVEGKAAIYAKPESRSDATECSKGTGSFFFAMTAEDVQRTKDHYKAKMEATTEPQFWEISGNTASLFKECTPLYKALPPLPKTPVLLLMGAFSPAMLVQECCERLATKITNNAFAYIPCSKQWWEVEGDSAEETVAGWIGEVVNQKGKHFDMKELVRRFQ